MTGRLLVIGLALVFAASYAAAQVGADKRRSGYQDMGEALQKMQDDDTANPGMLFVQLGGQLWNRAVGAADKSCADCHGDAAVSMKGVAARYPAFNEASKTPIDLQGRINLCRQDQQKATPLAPESRDLLALSAFIGLQSRGMPTAPPDDPRLTPFRERGRALWSQRMGQLNFSCAQCHDDNWGKHLGSAPIPQAHANAYPIYRLEWQGMGSLQRRMRNCMSGVRAQAFPYGAQEFVELELYLAQRARGMPVETPGVRP
jgi:sulfur-oxidizing protein SoxA